MKILLVEDSATLRFAMESYIREAGHESLIAENGEKAVQLVEQTDIDMILMDVEMPGLDGFETTHLIRESLNDHWIPIIFVTGKDDEESIEEGIAVGGDDYLIKPVSKVILHSKIKAMERIANMRSQLHTLNDKLTHLSQRDGLTQLLNRHTFDERANEAWRMATRDKQPLTVLLFDVDYFKRYNDTYGHLAGDECLRQVAQAIRACFNRPGDIAARYGGEEFIVILPNTGFKGATHLTEYICQAIRDLNIPHEGSPEFGKVTMSAGACTTRYTTGAKIEQIIDTADTALYKSKADGRNRTNVLRFKGLRKVLLIENTPDTGQCISDTLIEHCELDIVYADTEPKHFDVAINPELIIIHVKHEQDETLNAHQYLKDEYQFNHVPVLLLSSLEEEQTLLLKTQLNAKDVISLPIQKHRLIAKINKYIKH